MVIVFTLCSRNYLAQAITLYNSFVCKNDSVRFVFGLVDILSDNEYKYLEGCEVLEVAKLENQYIDEMYKRYNIIELNTAVKPYYIDYFFKQYFAEKVIYFDPDVFIFCSIEDIIKKLDIYSYILTPHFCSPIYDKFLLPEQVALRTGSFNLGFFAIRNDYIGNQLVDWWCKKLRFECIMDLNKGYFVDQKWMNLAICYFANFLIERHPGYNVAYWNLHERFIEVTNNFEYKVNGTDLLFFHFSSYKPDQPEVISMLQDRIAFDSRPDIEPIFALYRTHLVKNGYFKFKDMKPFYGLNLSSSESGSFRNRVETAIRKLLSFASN